jgi:hypothetical protein
MCAVRPSRNLRPPPSGARHSHFCIQHPATSTQWPVEREASESESATSTAGSWQPLACGVPLAASRQWACCSSSAERVQRRFLTKRVCPMQYRHRPRSSYIYRTPHHCHIQLVRLRTSKNEKTKDAPPPLLTAGRPTNGNPSQPTTAAQLAAAAASRAEDSSWQRAWGCGCGLGPEGLGAGAGGWRQSAGGPCA